MRIERTHDYKGLGNIKLKELNKFLYCRTSQSFSFPCALWIPKRVDHPQFSWSCGPGSARCSTFCICALRSPLVPLPLNPELEVRLSWTPPWTAPTLKTYWCFHSNNDGLDLRKRGWIFPLFSYILRAKHSPGHGVNNSSVILLMKKWKRIPNSDSIKLKVMMCGLWSVYNYSVTMTLM